MKTTPNKRNVGRPHQGLYKITPEGEILQQPPSHEGPYVVYGLTSTNTPDAIQYVGFTSRSLNKRYNDHLAKPNPNGSLKQQWISDIRLNDHKMILVVLEQGIQTYEQAKQSEEQYITLFDKIHPLKNSMKARTGLKGLKHSPETRVKQSKAHKNKEISTETRSRMSASMKNRKQRAQEPKNGNKTPD